MVMDLVDLMSVRSERRCGTCVHRNSVEDGPSGYCEPGGEERTPNQEPCDFWFGFEQLRKPLYGSKR